jgi:pimeloyl-ACP methyl ester carboxylesterase
MGGFVGLRVAARWPDLVHSLILLDTAAEEEPARNLPRYRRLTFVARWFGMTLVTGPVMKIMFGPKFLEDPRRSAERETMRRRLAAIDRRGVVRAVKGVIERESILPELGRIRCPTLVIVGDADAATPPPKARVIHEAIAGSKLVVVPDAGHTSCVEEPEAVTGAMVSFLDELPRV